MARITVVVNQKGGVGKTSTAHALISGLNLQGYKVLAIDSDPQGNLSDTMQADTDKPNLYTMMRGEVDAAQAIQHTAQGDIICSNLYLSGADMEFTQTGREYKLREALVPVKEQYTHIVIDAPPALGILTINGLTAATDVIIPVGADIYSVQGLTQLSSTVDSVRKYSNPALTISGILITRKDTRPTLTQQFVTVIQYCADSLKWPLYKTTIREAVAVKEAQALRQSIFESSPRANVTADYRAFINDYLIQGSEGASIKQ